jgi:hypothetical protein
LFGERRSGPHIDVPAQIVTDVGVTLAQNPMARALVGDQASYRGPRRSIVYRWFTDAEQRRLHPEEDHPVLSRSHVESLRAVHGARGEDPEVEELVALVRMQSAEFAALRDDHEVATRVATKRFVHPLIGTVELHCSILRAGSPAERLFAPEPGGEAEERLAWLALSGLHPKTANAREGSARWIAKDPRDGGRGGVRLTPPQFPGALTR